jgi:hypothetical protein
MKEFIAGMITGCLLLGFAVLAQQSTGEKVVQPQILADNQKVTIVRWVLQPGG